MTGSVIVVIGARRLEDGHSDVWIEGVAATERAADNIIAFAVAEATSNVTGRMGDATLSFHKHKHEVQNA